MQNKKNSNIVYYTCIAVIIFFWGCSVEQTHKTLTFFFDGVDELKLFNNDLWRDSVNKDAIAKREDVLKKNRPDLFVHMPYKEKKCEKCHTPDKHLRMPLPGLCFQCHKNFSETYAYVHGPVASGNCLKCHNQHVSSYPKLLARPGQQLCTYCHSVTTVFRNRFHRDIEDAECTMCHNPHGGNNRFMIKESIAKNFKGLGLTDEFDPRHMTAQIFSKVPGDVGYGKEIYILNEDGEVVSTTQTDNEGRFTLLNLHPNQNYTFKFKNETPCCKVNIINAKNEVVYVIDMNKKGKYIFDKTAYETVHKSIPKLEHQNEVSHVSSLKDTTKQDIGMSPDTTKNQAGNANINTKLPDNVIIDVNKTDSTITKGKIIVKMIPDSVSTEEILAGKIDVDTTENKNNADVAVSKSKIVVKTIPDSVSTEEVLRSVRAADTSRSAKNVFSEDISTTVNSKSKIIVKNLPDADSADQILNNAQAGQKNIPDTSGGIKVCGKSLKKLSEQIFPYYSGVVVWVLDDAGRLLGTAKVGMNGDFLLEGYPPTYHIKLPPKDKNIVSRVIYLNKDMELIEIVDKKVVDGHVTYIHVPSKQSNYLFKVEDDSDESLQLISTIYFEHGKSAISSTGKTELNKVAAYLIINREFRVDVIGYPDSKGASGDNKILAEDRVNAVINYLVLKGVNSSRIAGKGSVSPSKKNNELGKDDKNRNYKTVDIYVR